MNRALILQQNPRTFKGIDTWVLIFHHNSSNKDFFRNENEALFSTKKNKFSLFGRINDDFKIDDRYEFIIEYPQTKRFYQWTQTKNPIKAKAYEYIGFIPNETGYGDFTGLALSNYKRCTLLDGFVNHSYWNIAIGAYRNWDSDRCFPGPGGTNASFCYNTVNVYMRINDAQKLERLLSFNLCTRRIRCRTYRVFLNFIFIGILR